MNKLMAQSLIGWLASLSVLCMWCADTSAAGIKAVVTIPPLKGILEPLLPEGSTVQVLMSPGRSEHNYEFTPADMAAIGSADVVMFVGLGLEPQVSKFLESHSDPKRTDIGLAVAAGVCGEDGVVSEHLHEEDEGHQHGAIDPHVWLDPALVLAAIPQLEIAVATAMKARGEWDDDSGKRLQDAAAAERARVEALDAEFRVKLRPFKGDSIVTHHAAFGRLAARYGLIVAEVIRLNEGEEPTPGRIAAVVQAVRKAGVRAIFVEPQFDSATAQRIARAAGVRLVTLDPLGTGDWFGMMRENLDGLATGLGGKQSEGN